MRIKGARIAVCVLLISLAILVLAPLKAFSQPRSDWPRWRPALVRFITRWRWVDTALGHVHDYQWIHVEEIGEFPTRWMETEND